MKEHTSYPAASRDRQTAKAGLKLVLLKYNMDVEYVATCRGLTSGKKLEIEGR